MLIHQEKRRRGRPNLMWKHACKRDMAMAGLKEVNDDKHGIMGEDNVQSSRQPQITRQATDKEEEGHLQLPTE